MSVASNRFSASAFFSSASLRGSARLLSGCSALSLLLLAGCAETSETGDGNPGDTMMVSSAEKTVDTAAAAKPAGLTPSLPNNLRVGGATMGIGVSRDQVDKGMGDTYTFMEFDAVEGHPSVIAEYGDIHSMLIGPADDLLVASIFAPYVGEQSNDDASNEAVRGFVRSVTPDAMEWINTNIAASISSNTKSAQTKTFGDHKVDYAYDLYEGHTDAGHVIITVTHI